MELIVAATNLEVSEKRMNGFVGSNRLRSRAAASPTTGEGSGGNMDDVSKRLGTVETAVAEIRAIVPHLATKADVNSLKAEIKDDLNAFKSEIKDEMSGLRSELKDDLNGFKSEITGDMSALKSELKEDMSNLRSELKEDMSNLRSEIKDDIHGLTSELKDGVHSAKTETQTLRAEMHLLRADMNSMEARMIRWMIGTVLSTAALAFSIAKFIH